jgi:hypothetical protein
MGYFSGKWEIQIKNPKKNKQTIGEILTKKQLSCEIQI